MEFSIMVGLLIGVPGLLLALPAAVRDRSWSAFGLALIQSLGGIVLPLWAFIGAVFLVPDWKGACRLGAVDCFHVGKLALLPLVLWAMAAFYRVTVRPAQRPHRAWVRLGLCHGAFISAVCLAHGLVTLKSEPPMVIGMLIPLYTAAWYGITAYRIVFRDEPEMTPAEELTAVMSGGPFWLLAALLSYLQYRGLPEHPPSCFVVTAASRGHARLVGPFAQVSRRGRPRFANRQLLVFWAFEEAWRRRHPRSHRRFRTLYNAWGPRAARGIRHPLAADAVFLALKPLETLASLVLALDASRTSTTERSRPHHEHAA